MSFTLKPKKKSLRDFELKIKNNFDWNFKVIAIHSTLFWASISFISSSTVLPAFLRNFTSSNFLIGLIPSIQMLGNLLPGLMFANYAERLPCKKGFVLRVSVIQRLSWFFLASMTFFLTGDLFSGMLLFFLFYTITRFSGGIDLPAFFDMIAKLIPVRKRGALSGVSNFFGGCLGMLGALLVGYILRRHVFPTNFALCFLMSVILQFASLGCLFLIREPPSPVIKRFVTFRDYIHQLPETLKKDKNFSLFLVSRLILSFSGMATSFYIIHAINRINLTGSEIGVFTFLLVGTQTFSNLLWGRIADKKGYKLILQLGTLFHILAALLAIFSSSNFHFYIVFILVGGAFGGYMISEQNIVMEFARPEDRPTYIGLSNAIKAPFLGVAPILAGLLADRFQLPVVFLLAATILSFGLISLSFVKDPRKPK
jgi:MFS family permease